VRLAFTKMHGVGNDYLFVDLTGGRPMPPDLPGLARAMSHRRLGVGADGLILVLPSTAADLHMRVFNADGSEAEMCGNGVRCLARLAWDRGLAPLGPLTVETAAGKIKAEPVLEGNRLVAVRVDLGEPRLARRDIPLAGSEEDRPDEPVIARSLSVEGRTLGFTAVSMGNPHCVIAVDNVGAVDLEELGPQVERHPWFPRRTNVEFVQVIDRSRLRMRVWERGSGVTSGSGTGAAAALVACVLERRCDRRARVLMDGGELEVEWAADGRIWQAGPAVEVFQGEFPLPEGGSGP